jgi:hypothetical protein
MKERPLKLAFDNGSWAKIDAGHFGAEQSVSLFQYLKYLASEMPTESGIDAGQRSYAVFKDRRRWDVSI